MFKLFLAGMCGSVLLLAPVVAPASAAAVHPFCSPIGACTDGNGDPLRTADHPDFNFEIAGQQTDSYLTAALSPNNDDIASGAVMLIPANAWASGEVDRLLGIAVAQADPADGLPPSVPAFDPSSMVVLAYQADLDTITANSALLSERLLSTRNRFGFGLDLPLTAYAVEFSRPKTGAAGKASGGASPMAGILEHLTPLFWGALLLAPGVFALAILRRRQHG